MKQIVRNELESEGYFVIEEPIYPPTKRIAWSYYRPDLLGYYKAGTREEFALVECETRPNMKRFREKNYSSVRFQAGLFRLGSIRRILAVPQGTLSKVDLKLRCNWEVWVLGTHRPISTIGLIQSTDGQGAMPVAQSASLPTG